MKCVIREFALEKMLYNLDLVENLKNKKLEPMGKKSESFWSTLCVRSSKNEKKYFIFLTYFAYYAVYSNDYSSMIFHKRVILLLADFVCKQVVEEMKNPARLELQNLKQFDFCRRKYQP